jgi:beta-lactamase regulating signal transducer with metallopeptidase domain
MFGLEIHHLLRGALVLALACALVLILVRASANLRRLVLVWGFVGALAAPVLSVALARTPVSEIVSVDTTRLNRVRVDPGPRFTSAYRWERMSAWLDAPESPQRARANPLWLLLVAGMGIALIPLLFAHARVLYLLRGARPAHVLGDSVERACRETSARARVSFSSHVMAPIVTGVFRPHVLLPEAAAGWSEARLQTVLRHELTHVKQRDALTQLIAELACVIQWWNPIAWWAKSRLERERELAADESVVAGGMLPSAYASELLAIASELNGVETTCAAIPVLGRSALALRIERILARRPALPGTLQKLALFGLALAVTLVVACASTRAQSARSRNVRAVSSPPGATATSIDPRVQGVVDAELARAKQEWSARAASIVVSDPKTGRVLALGNPEVAREIRTPASTFKPFVIAAALEAGAIQGDERFDCEHGQRQYGGGLTLRDSASHGELDVTQIVAQSSNIGVSKIFDKLGGPGLTSWFVRFHLNEAVLDSAPGGLRELNASSAGTIQGATIATGFGAKLSPLHIAALYGVFANQGEWVAPTLSSDVSPAPERVLRPETAARVVAMLESAVRDGTGKAAGIDGVRVAGKTGTADLDDANADAHSIAYFAGIVPANAPRYVIVVVVEDPKQAASGGRAAAPVFARVASQIL